MRFGRFLSAFAIVVGLQLGIVVAPELLGTAQAGWVQQYQPFLDYAVPIVVGLVFWKVKGGLGGDVTKVATGLFVMDLILLTAVVVYTGSAAARAGATNPQAIADVIKQDFSGADDVLVDFVGIFLPDIAENYRQRHENTAVHRLRPPPHPV